MRRALRVGLLGGVACAALAPAPASAARAEASVTRLGPPAATQQLEIVLPLHADYSGLERWAQIVNARHLQSYGRFQSIAQLARRFGAGATVRQRVLAYLHRVGATHVRLDATGLFVDASVGAALAEGLFAAPLERLHSARDGRFIAPSSQVRVPLALRGLVTGVLGLNTRPVLEPAARRARPAATCPFPTCTDYFPASGTTSGCAAATGIGGFTPNQYLTAYNYAPLRARGLAGQGERVALLEVDGFKPHDIATFTSCFGLAQPPINVFGVGVSSPLPPGGESTLDIEVLDAAAPGLKAIDDYETQPSSAYLIRALSAPLQVASRRPQVVSLSLGICEPTLYDSLGSGGVRLAEGVLAMAAADGVSYLAASGDTGSASCVNGSGQLIHELSVSYPASSAWVTGVGGTQLMLNADNSIANHYVWNDGKDVPESAGGGGFSSKFPRPAYQAGVVGRNSRAVPDVSLLADIGPGYDVYCSATADLCGGAGWQSVGGTSAATPLLAGGLAVVDQDLRRHGLQNVGFANPLLYGVGRSKLRNDVFYDVTLGNNDDGTTFGNDMPLGCCTAGTGFDEASGWGSVDLQNLDIVALAVEPARFRLSLPGHQSPVKHGHILATVTCAARCSLGAVAQVTIDHRRPFKIASRRYTLQRADHKTVTLTFTARQQSRLRSALRHGTSITALVQGILVDASGHIISTTATKSVKITS